MRKLKKRYCPKCGHGLEKEDWTGNRYRCPVCGLDGSRKQTLLGDPERKIWDGGYDDLDKDGKVVVTYPESKEIPELDGFKDNAWLITDDEGMKLYGSYSYVCREDWLDNF